MLDKAARYVPNIERRKNWRPGRFNKKRFRPLQHFVLGVGKAGLSVREQRLLCAFLDVWVDQKQETPMDDTEVFSPRDVFPTPHAFFNAHRDDIIQAALAAGWRKERIKEGGIVYGACFRPALAVLLRLLSRGKATSLGAARQDRRHRPRCASRQWTTMLSVYAIRLSWSVTGTTRLFWQCACTATAAWCRRLAVSFKLDLVMCVCLLRRRRVVGVSVECVRHSHTGLLLLLCP